MKWAAFVTLFLYTTAQSSFADEASWTISLKSAEVFQGGILEMRILGRGLSEVKGSFQNQEITFFPEKDGSFISLVGLDLDEKLGLKKIAIKGLGRGREMVESVTRFRVIERPFLQERITVSSLFDRFDEATSKRIHKEQEQMARIWTVHSPRRLWEGRFLAPVAGAITSPFGLRRIVNGSPRFPHGGVDLKASLGTDIAAANHGRVVLQEEFFFSGKSIVLDHGGGLYTMYFHLADFHAERGSEVRKGELIGWAGMTGRVTGPHLHWGVRLNGARVDPFQLLETVVDNQ